MYKDEGKRSIFECQRGHICVTSLMNSPLGKRNREREKIEKLSNKKKGRRKVKKAKKKQKEKGEKRNEETEREIEN